MATPHIDAEPGDFAPSVLMPGDPLRATYIAERHLEQAHLVTNGLDVAIQVLLGSYRHVGILRVKLLTRVVYVEDPSA